MTDECRKAIESYLERLRGSFQVRDSQDGCIVVTPFMRRDNDFIEVALVSQPDGSILVTDYAETVDYLALEGLNIHRSREARRCLDQTARRFNVEIVDDEIRAIAAPDTLGETFERVVQAAQDVAYLVYRRLRRPAPTFDEKVERVLIGEGIKYDPEFRVEGVARTHTFRFYVDSEKNALLQPLSATSPHSALVKAERLAFSWFDIRDPWPNYRKIAVVDDEKGKERLWSPDALTTLETYSDLVIRWTRYDELVPALR